MGHWKIMLSHTKKKLDCMQPWSMKMFSDIITVKMYQFVRGLSLFQGHKWDFTSVLDGSGRKRLCSASMQITGRACIYIYIVKYACHTFWRIIFALFFLRFMSFEGDNRSNKKEMKIKDF